MAMAPWSPQEKELTIKTAIAPGGRTSQTDTYIGNLKTITPFASEELKQGHKETVEQLEAGHGIDTEAWSAFKKYETFKKIETAWAYPPNNPSIADVQTSLSNFMAAVTSETDPFAKGYMQGRILEVIDIDKIGTGLAPAQKDDLQKAALAEIIGQLENSGQAGGLAAGRMTAELIGNISNDNLIKLIKNPRIDDNVLTSYGAPITLKSLLAAEINRRMSAIIDEASIADPNVRYRSNMRFIDNLLADPAARAALLSDPNNPGNPILNAGIITTIGNTDAQILAHLNWAKPKVEEQLKKRGTAAAPTVPAAIPGSTVTTGPVGGITTPAVPSRVIPGLGITPPIPAVHIGGRREPIFNPAALKPSSTEYNAALGSLTPQEKFSIQSLVDEIEAQATSNDELRLYISKLKAELSARKWKSTQEMLKYNWQGVKTYAPYLLIAGLAVGMYYGLDPASMGKLNAAGWAMAAGGIGGGALYTKQIIGGEFANMATQKVGLIDAKMEERLWRRMQGLGSQEYASRMDLYRAEQFARIEFQTRITADPGNYDTEDKQKKLWEEIYKNYQIKRFQAKAALLRGNIDQMFEIKNGLDRKLHPQQTAGATA